MNISLQRLLAIIILPILGVSIWIIIISIMEQIPLPTGEIEKKYFYNGTWTMSPEPSRECDSNGKRFQIFYPDRLGEGGFHHPIITWGVGTLSRPENYKFLFEHLVSWGFVVIATEDQANGAGQSILDAANCMIAENGDPQSTFFNKLNVGSIGAAGHSQGASGAINAAIKSAGRIKTVIAFELPKPYWCINAPEKCVKTKDLTQTSIFFMSGSADTISPAQDVKAYYDSAPSTVAKLMGILIGADHNDVKGQPACADNEFFCKAGAYGYLGYPTAWLMDQLQGDAYAHGAFISGSGEIFFQTSNWEQVESNL